MLMEQIGQVAENHNLTETLLISGLVVSSLVGLIRSYRSLDSDDFDDNVFLDREDAPGTG
jgi:hypothetical protein